MRRLGALLFLLGAGTLAAQVERVVVLKVDGLPPRLIEQYLDEPAARQGREGHSRLPWIEHVFAEGGAWVENFYARGLSLSAPSWSLLDTGRHLQIRGNVEYDRYTLRPYDYLNFFPFYFKASVGNRVDMTGVELLDSLGVPLMIDRFGYGGWFQGSQLLQRGVVWRTLDRTLTRTLAAVSPRDFIDEWQVGWDWSESFYRQNEEELIRALKDPRVKYLELFTGDYDHVAHLTNDPVTQLHEIESLDALVGRLWSAIAESPLAEKTALVMVSDHGMNTSPGIYSQGYNLIDWFNSRAGGAHHVLTNRHPMQEFKLKGLDPFVSAVITPSTQSRYMASLGDQYPTAMLDLDGNERASIGLRNNTFNVLHILLDQLINRKAAGAVRVAALSALFEALDSVRAEWSRDLDALARELAALDEQIAAQQAHVDAQPRKWTDAEIAQGLHREANRAARFLDTWKTERASYAAYAATIRRLLALSPADFDPGKFKMTDLIPAKSLGPPNSLWDLRNYVTGPAAGGLVLKDDGSLDWEQSFERIDYFPALSALHVRNNVQSGVSPQPVDFIATRIPREALRASLAPEDFPDHDAVWLWEDPEHQALILRRGGELRYLPVANLIPAADGSVAFERRAWAAGFPLRLFEDPQLEVPAAWLDGWHPEREWLKATHRTRYSNGVIGLTEALLDLDPLSADPYLARQQRLRRTDLLVFARDHWNFNVRGFNPGGNHGSLLRDSTRSVWMIAGGSQTGLPHGVRIETPYDSLSFAPTILTLMGRPEPDLPGPVVNELLPPELP